MSEFPQVVGSLDGSYVQIIAPKPDQNSNNFICHKKYHALILQATVDADLKFMDVSTGFSASLHNARILQLSSIFHRAENHPIKLVC